MEPSENGENERLVGASVRRKEDYRLIQGEGRYTGDIMPANAAVMLVLRQSPCPRPHPQHGRGPRPGPCRA